VNYPVGTIVVYDQTVENPSGTQTKRVTYKLVAISDNKAVVECSVVSTRVDGKTDTSKSVAEHHKPSGSQPARDSLASARGNPATVASETVSLAGKSFSCTVLQTRLEAEGSMTDVKYWYCADVPGALVRSEIKTTGGGNMTTTVVLAEIGTETGK